MFIRNLIVSLGVITAVSISVSAQGWRGIVPLKSDCETVKRSLGIPQCRTGTYQLSEGSISISFSDGTCQTGWNVSAGTVISFSLYTKSKQKLGDAFSDLSQYVKSSDGHVRAISNYTNADEGVTITAAEDGTIASTFYGPSSKDLALKCDNEISQEPPLPKGAMKFDQFEFLEKSEEERRLDNFATLINDWSGATGYIVGYTGKGGGEDGLSRAYRVKDFVTEHGVSQDRVIVLIGAPKEESTIELWWINFRRPPR